MMRWMLNLSVLFALFGGFWVEAKPIALVYQGPGACFQCWMSAAQNAKKAGFKVQFVDEHLQDFSVFDRSVLWVQPGGKSTTAAKAMGPDYLEKIRNFVHNGGGYVGFCAGAFIATAKIGTTTMDGLGIVPGRTELWDKSDGPGHLVTITWDQEVRKVYYHGGPFLDFSGIHEPSLNVYSYYENGQVAGATVNFGQGRVAVTGAHPEAARLWKAAKRIRDPDGSDQPVVVQLMKWAARN